MGRTGRGAGVDRLKNRSEKCEGGGGVEGVKNRSGQWEGPGGGGARRVHYAPGTH
jgi:hypothetical protein